MNGGNIKKTSHQLQSLPRKTYIIDFQDFVLEVRNYVAIIEGLRSKRVLKRNFKISRKIRLNITLLRAT